jgi:type II secretory pathway pseudopilin PulG
MRALVAIRARARLGDETGLTLIEVLVGAIVLVLGAAATFGILATATKNAQRAKASQVVLDLAQEELERLRGVPYGSLALSTMPGTVSESLNPNSRVAAGQFDLTRGGTAEWAPLVIDEDGISPESQFFSGGDSGVRGTVYRYVVWRNDPNCPAAQCPGEDDYKQLIVAVRPDTPANQSGSRGYVEVQSEIVNPEAFDDAPDPPDDGGDDDGGGGGPTGEPGTSVTAQQFFLSDTACAKSGTTVRQEITGDHLLHNTLGTCWDGAQTGTTAGAPDALLRSAPPDPDPADESNPLLYDYSDDFYLEPTPDTDKGVQIRRDDTSGCHFDPTGSSNPESQTHRWISDPMVSPFKMTEKATLEFSTRTLNDTLHTGSLCLFLFKRSESGSPPKPNDTLLTDKSGGAAYWKYTPEGNGFWPRFSWAKIRVTMFFAGAPYTILKDERLGIAIGVERANTPADAIPIMYDHPNYPTRIEVDTDTPIEGG